PSVQRRNRMHAVSRRMFMQRTGGAAAGLAVLCSCNSRAPVGGSAALNPRPKIGFISPVLGGDSNNPIWPELAKLGWRVGDNVEQVFRFAYVEDVNSVAAELVNLRVSLIITQGEPSAQAATAATESIPIVMTAVSDALSAGLVTNLAHPGGNVTGMTMLGPEVAAKRMDLLHEIAPNMGGVAVLWNRAVVDTAREFANLERAAQALGLRLRPLEGTASTPVVMRAIAA